MCNRCLLANGSWCSTLCWIFLSCLVALLLFVFLLLSRRWLRFGLDFLHDRNLVFYLGDAALVGKPKGKMSHRSTGTFLNLLGHVSANLIGRLHTACDKLQHVSCRRATFRYTDCHGDRLVVIGIWVELRADVFSFANDEERCEHLVGIEEFEDSIFREAEAVRRGTRALKLEHDRVAWVSRWWGWLMWVLWMLLGHRI